MLSIQYGDSKRIQATHLLLLCALLKLRLLGGLGRSVLDLNALIDKHALGRLADALAALLGCLYQSGLIVLFSIATILSVEPFGFEHTWLTRSVQDGSYVLLSPADPHLARRLLLLLALLRARLGQNHRVHVVHGGGCRVVLVVSLRITILVGTFSRTGGLLAGALWLRCWLLLSLLS